MSYLLDSNVLSEFTKPMPDGRVLEWFTNQPLDQLWVSVITLGEIERGILLLDEGSRRRNLTAWLGRLRTSFEGQVLEISEEIMRAWAQLYASPSSNDGVKGGLDSLLAATAMHHGLTVATRNLLDFPEAVLAFNPWQ